MSRFYITLDLIVAPNVSFIPASVKTYGYLGKPLVRYLHTVSEVAARGPAVTRGSFLAGAHRELSVALIKCQASVYGDCSNYLSIATDRQVSPGAEILYEDWYRVVHEYISALVGCSKQVVGLYISCNFVLPCCTCS